MKKEITSLFLFLTTLVLLPSCERDEICIDPITPKLYIAFYDLDDPESKKSVNNLAVEILDVDIENNTLDTLGRDSIGIPLNIYENKTTVVLTANSRDNTLINQDTISITYDTEEVFVGRSCGYKMIFNNINITKGSESLENQWIKSISIEQREIENENKAHVTVLH